MVIIQSSGFYLFGCSVSLSFIQYTIDSVMWIPSNGPAQLIGLAFKISRFFKLLVINKILLFLDESTKVRRHYQMIPFGTI